MKMSVEQGQRDSLVEESRGERGAFLVWVGDEIEGGKKPCVPRPRPHKYVCFADPPSRLSDRETSSRLIGGVISLAVLSPSYPTLPKSQTVFGPLHAMSP